MDHLDFSCHTVCTDVRMFLVNIKGKPLLLWWECNDRFLWNLVCSSINLFGPLVPISTSRHFQFLKKICLTVSKCFHVSTHKSFAYYQLHQNKSKFLDYNIYKSFLRKGMSWIVGILPFSVYMIIEYKSMSLFGYSICVWHLKLCISFVWKYENVIKLLLLRA